jgi:TetR/AcrR family transcriptional regulator, tetracycline repressor protein
MSRLDQSQIVEAALELLDGEGLAGVTTRRVAAKLGVKSASLYWHVSNREQLLDLLSDRIVADARWPSPSARWRTRVEGLMTEYLRCLLAHRDAARVTAGRPPKGPNRLRGAELLLNALLRAGLTDLQAIDAGLVLTTYVVGFALEHQAAEAASPPVNGLDDAFFETYPTLRHLADKMRPGIGPGRFHEGLKLVLDGVQASTKQARARRS